MDIDIEAAVRYPMESEDWLMTILIGGVLALLSILLVPLFLLSGYFVRVLRAGMADAPEPPAFDDWGTLLTEGVVAFVVILVYNLVPLVVFGVTVGGSILAFATGSEAGAGLGVLGLLGGISLTFVLSLVFGYFAVVGVANYAHEGTFGAAFDLGVIRDVALDGTYAVPFFVGVALLVAASILTSMLSVVPFVGTVVGVFVTFYAQIAAGRLWGRGYADSRDLSPEEAPGTGDSSPAV